MFGARMLRVPSCMEAMELVEDGGGKSNLGPSVVHVGTFGAAVAKRGSVLGLGFRV